MRLVPAISITTLVVSVAALVLVLLLFITEPWEPEAEQPATKVHTQELDEVMVEKVIEEHVLELIESKGISDGDDAEAFGTIPGYLCLWTQYLDYSEDQGGINLAYPNVWPPKHIYITYNYIEKEDIWLVTSVIGRCKSDVETWVIDDNTGAITYGRPDVRGE